MKVDGSGPVGRSSDTKKNQRSQKAGGSGGAFSSALGSVESKGASTPAVAADGVEPTHGVSAVDALLAVQATAPVGTGPDRQERERQARYGARLLDGLEEVRKGLLAGRISKDALAGLARDMREKREKNVDPALAPLLDEIELRAQVELAKLTRR